jgi:glyoxylase-like metal-dependent hydrolase (beta-lactamase superfamily II)
MQLGRFRLSVLTDTLFRLDGGAMFGVVPRVLWEKKKPADEQHRIQMAAQSLLIEAEDALVLVDTGLGEKLDERGRAQFDIPPGERLPEALARAGHGVEEVTHVILTHLHFDHCGWSTRRQGDGWVPTFPRARYFIQRDELAHARAPNDRDRPSYLPENFEPLLAAGAVEPFDEEAEPVPGVRAVRAPGHTAGMCVVTVDGGADGTAVFLADLVPTAAHLPIPWVMGFDLFPVTTMETTRRWLERAAAERWLCVFQHDPEVPMARLVAERPGRYRAEPVAEPAPKRG